MLTKLAGYPYVGLLPAVSLSGQSHDTFVQISLAQDSARNGYPADTRVSLNTRVIFFTKLGTLYF